VQLESFDAVAAALSPAAATTAGPLRMRFVGDVIFGRYKDGKHRRLASDDDPVFEEVAQLLAGDWVVANLETPLANELPESNTRKGHFFGATKQMAAALAAAGFDAVSLANNHAADLGVEGLRQSPRLLRELGVVPFGEANDGGRPSLQTIEVDGVRLGVIAVSAHANFEMPEQAPAVPLVRVKELARVLGPLLAEAEVSADLSIVMIHWGVEYSRYPDPVQRAAARALVEQGADVVIGHHPHVLQEVELYRGGIIAYSLGNFLFENVTPEPRLTGVLGIDFERPSLCNVAVHFAPAVMQHGPYVHPIPASGRSAELARRRVRPLQEEQRVRWRRDGEALVARIERENCGTAE
jgi:poly-gamma-glutamate capsule biosynthesis protein CapA/YwtB (metallophosphatase superfamily)